MAYSINFHFVGEVTFSNGWTLLWAGKDNQDTYKKRYNEMFKSLIKALKPGMIADGRKPNKGNVYYYHATPEYKEWMPKIHELNDWLSKDNEAVRKYIALMKETGEYMPR